MIKEPLRFITYPFTPKHKPSPENPAFCSNQDLVPASSIDYGTVIVRRKDDDIRKA